MSEFEILDPSKGYQRLSGFCALGIMTKVPVAGKVKTRLTPPLTPDESAELNRCFLRDISSSIAVSAAETAAQGVAIYTPVGGEDSYGSILPTSFLLIPQRGENFGERLRFAVVDLLAVGFASACLINSDSPTVLADHFSEAVRELEKPGDRIVIGPSEDGGYYLIGMKKIHSRLFEEIDWSTDRVFEQTVERAKAIGVDVHEIPRGFDVDDEATLRRLWQELLGETAEDQTAPSTQKFLRELSERKVL